MLRSSLPGTVLALVQKVKLFTSLTCFRRTRRDETRRDLIILAGRCLSCMK